MTSSVDSDLQAPLADGLVANHNAALGHHLLHIAIAEAERKYSYTHWLMISAEKPWRKWAGNRALKPLPADRLLQQYRALLIGYTDLSISRVVGRAFSFS